MGEIIEMKVAGAVLLALLVNLTMAQEEEDSRPAGVAFAAAAAANGGDNCYCQCSSFTYRNNRGQVHGNCKSSFNGAQWCYIDNRWPECQDTANSNRFRGVGPGAMRRAPLRPSTRPSAGTPETTHMSTE